MAVVSHLLPPTIVGQTIVLYRLLKTWKSNEYCLISRTDYSKLRSDSEYNNSTLWLSAEYFHLAGGFQFRVPGFRYLSLFFSLLNLLLGLFQRAKRIVQVVRDKECEAIIACSGDVLDIPSAFLASRFARIRFYVYLFDDYKYQWVNPFLRWFAATMEKLIMKKAENVIVPNEYLADAYGQRYGIGTVIVHNPTMVFEDTNEGDRLPDPTRIRIVYTGSVYHAHYDAFRNLIKAIQNINGFKINLCIYAAQSLEELEAVGICGPIELNDPVPGDEIADIQKQADILFLPLAFESEIPEIIKTSAPGKMGEYLASGTPVLVHAPDDTFVSWYFREYQCDSVVTKLEVEPLANAVTTLIERDDLRKKISKNALRRAREDFSIEVSSQIFRDQFIKKGR